MSSLEEEIRTRRREIATDAYSMSLGELTSLYRDGEVDIHPEFQRVYRWDARQKTRLMESILLGIPLPSIFVAQKEDGGWDVVDGVQRLSAIFEFQGVLKGEEGRVLPGLILEGTDYLPSMAGKTWEDVEAPGGSLTHAQRLDFRRAKVDVKIIKRESDPQAKYDLFQRLNSYGSQLTSQELRSCLLISANPRFYNWLHELSLHPAFVSTTALHGRLIKEQYGVELALRFLIFRTFADERLKTIGNVGEFLTRESLAFASDGRFRYDDEAEAFGSTFQLLADNGGEDVFRRYNVQKERFQGAFLNTAFEIVGMGLGFHINYYSAHAEDVDAQERARIIWSDPTLRSGFATGVSAETRLAQTIPRGRELWSPKRDERAG